MIFAFKTENGKLTIVDLPTTLRTSYSSADLILHLEADEVLDKFSETWFINKEFSLFARTLEHLLANENSLKMLSQRTNEAHINFAVQHVRIIRGWF